MNSSRFSLFRFSSSIHAARCCNFVLFHLFLCVFIFFSRFSISASVCFSFFVSFACLYAKHSSNCTTNYWIDAFLFYFSGWYEEKNTFFSLVHGFCQKNSKNCSYIFSFLIAARKTKSNCFRNLAFRKSSIFITFYIFCMSGKLYTCRVCVSKTHKTKNYDLANWKSLEKRNRLISNALA